MRPFRRAPLAAASIIAIGLFAVSTLGACSVINHIRPGAKGPKPKETASVAGQVDPRRYIGPDYCPELRIFDGAQLIRTYERGHQGDQNYVDLASLDRQDSARMPLRHGRRRDDQGRHLRARRRRPEGRG